VQGAASDAVSAVQARYYEVGAEISRLEQSLEHTRELRERQRTELAQTSATLAELAAHTARDESELAAVRAELTALAPELEATERDERAAAAALEAAEEALQQWQQRWEDHTRFANAATQSAEVERARIEQLAQQRQRLEDQAARLAAEHAALGAKRADEHLARLSAEEEQAREASQARSAALRGAQDRVQAARGALLDVETQLGTARDHREAVSTELTALEALQAAALSDQVGEAREWLSEAGLLARPRLAATLDVQSGWERAVETVLGEYLEAVCVEALDAPAAALASLTAGRVTLLERADSAAAAAANPTAQSTAPDTLASRVRGTGAPLAQLATIRTAASLAEALSRRSALGEGQSLITPAGEWIGRDWLRVSRGPEPRAGVLEREQRLKALRSTVAIAAMRLKDSEDTLGAARTALASAEAERELAQTAAQRSHEQHAELLGALQASRARATDSSQRSERLTADAGEVARDQAATTEALQRASEQLDRSLAERATLEVAGSALTGERDERRASLAAARVRAQAVQAAGRELHVRVESRRSTESSVSVRLDRMSEQREQLARRTAELEAELSSGDEPIRIIQERLEETLARRLVVESELAQARTALEECERALRTLDEERLAAEQRVNGAREALEQAKLASQETHVRRAALAEQFAQFGRDLGEILAGLEPSTDAAAWELTLAETRADIEKLGSVNLAAIDELKDHVQRKEYLDSQFADLTSALETLAEAMRRIDRETRARFESTFERINLGLREKFPRLFGGGHAYLELVGEDRLTAGVAVMARPPGKKNSTIHLLSGGEKALTAVALVFAIFDLNPAPFCLLDEVDAPLDEHNVGRFCDIVREMSNRIQFVFITHNKATMELASQLIGVTMNEPGVSRLVTVDVDEAVRMATA
jgi:chromosome segregation protein